MRFELEELVSRDMIMQEEFEVRSKLEPQFWTFDLLYEIFNPQRKKLKKEKTTYFFCTINPKSGPEIPEIKKLAQQLLKRKFMKDEPLVFEQRGKTKDDLGKGCHIHFIAKKLGMDRNHLHRELKKIFGSIVGNDKAIDIRPIPESWRNEKIEYMKGNKWDDGKLASVKLNSEFRKKNNIEDIYYG